MDDELNEDDLIAMYDAAIDQISRLMGDLGYKSVLIVRADEHTYKQDILVDDE